MLLHFALCQSYMMGPLHWNFKWQGKGSNTSSPSPMAGHIFRQDFSIFFGEPLLRKAKCYMRIDSVEKVKQA